MKDIFKSRKSQIGETITWFVAFVIIFFIMLLFISACGILRGNDSLNSLVKGDETAKGSGDVLDNKELYFNIMGSFLNSEMEKGVSVRDYIAKTDFTGTYSSDKKYQDKLQDFLIKNIKMEAGNRPFVIIYNLEEGKFVVGNIYLASFGEGDIPLYSYDEGLSEFKNVKVELPVSLNKKIVFGFHNSGYSADSGGGI